MQQERANESGDEEESPTTKATKAFAVSLEDSDEVRIRTLDFKAPFVKIIMIFETETI